MLPALPYHLALSVWTWSAFFSRLLLQDASPSALVFHINDPTLLCTGLLLSGFAWQAYLPQNHDTEAFCNQMRVALASTKSERLCQAISSGRRNEVSAFVMELRNMYVASALPCVGSLDFLEIEASQVGPLHHDDQDGEDSACSGSHKSISPQHPAKNSSDSLPISEDSAEVSFFLCQQ